MKILWFRFKDPKNPGAGGAEVVMDELGKRLIDDGHDVTFVVGGFEGGYETDTIHGYNVIRIGGFHTVFFLAPFYYFKHLRGKYDLVIDEINTAPFFARWYVKEPVLAFVHQLARKIWFYQFPFPLNIPFYLAEPIYLWMLRKYFVITVSESTKQDLVNLKFKPENIHIISEGLKDIEPVPTLEGIKKYDTPTVLALGSMRPMKLNLHAIKAFEVARDMMPTLRLKLVGDHSDPYGERCLEYIQASRHKDAIDVMGHISQEEKYEVMQKSHVLIYPSIREGWGLPVTEANSQGTPAVAYDVPGLRDSVQHEVTGLLAEKNTPEKLATGIVRLLTDPILYERLRVNGWKWSFDINFDQSYKDFQEAIDIFFREYWKK